jgi:hypothetical protein
VSKFYDFQHKTHQKIFVFQDISCSHEATGGEVLLRKGGPIIKAEEISWRLINDTNKLHNQISICVDRQ